MKKRLIGGFLAVLMLVLTACSPVTVEEPAPTYRDADGFQRFLEEIQPSTQSWTEQEKEQFMSWLQPEQISQNFTEAEIADFLVRETEVPDTVTVQQAAEDVRAAFELLSGCHGGYFYFGGDEVFHPIRDGILEKLETMGTEISTRDLWQLLWDALSPVVVDQHFFIATDDPDTYVNDRPYTQYTWYVPNLYFDDPSGVNSKYVKHTIGPDGAITYCLATVGFEEEVLPDTMEIEGVERNLTWVKMNPNWTDISGDASIYSRDVVGARKIPVLINYSLSGNPVKLEEFVASAAEWRKEPLFIIDLRGNGGGNDNYSSRWMAGFIGTPVSYKYMWAQKCSSVLLGAWEMIGFYDEGIKDNLNGWRGLPSSEAGAWETENTIFVMVDQFTGSAAESFIAELTLGKRVVLVGSNTRGGLNFGNVIALYLPNSEIQIRLGSSISFRDSLENDEGVGYYPDLWVTPGESLLSILRLCKYYGL